MTASHSTQPGWSTWAAWGVRWVLGAVFLYAAWPKLRDPAGFAVAISHYGLVPRPLLPAMATVLPGVEAVTGLALVTGQWRRGASLWVAVMLAVFTAAIASALARGLSIDCGCFTTQLSHARAAEVRSHMVTRLVEDLAMLGGAVWLVVHEWRNRGAPR